MVADFPKIECPFVRKTFEIDVADWKKYGSKLGLREPNVYLVTPEFSPGFEWVTDHKDTFSCEKLNGSNMAIVTEDNRIVHLQNRLNVIDMFQIKGGRASYVEAALLAVGKDYVEKSGVQFGEALGPKINCNDYNLPYHMWYPFSKAKESLRYTSFHKHEKSFLSFNAWFHKHLKSLFYCRWHKIPISEMFQRDDVPFAEGVVFYNPTLGNWMSKLRRDMFPWYYWDKIHIHDLPAWATEYAASIEVTPR